MIRNYTEKDMTVYELAQLITPILDRLDNRVAYLEENTVTKAEMAAMERRLNYKIEKNYVHVNKRIDILSEKFA